MSGEGRRFVNAGYHILKPLIRVDGKTMIEHVVSMFPNEDDFVFVCQKKHLEHTTMQSVLKKLKPNAEIVSVRKRLPGPVPTVLEASKYIRDEGPVIVNYCDFFQEWNYDHFKQMTLKNGCHGCVPCYRGFHPHLLGPNLYAGVRTDENNKMLEIREKHSFTKDKMDTFQSSGTYYFSQGGIMKKYFKQLIDSGKSINGEYYASMPYQFMIEDGLKSIVYEVKKFCQWGTPEDLEEYESWSRQFAKLSSKEKGITTTPSGRIPNYNLKKGKLDKRSAQYWADFFSKANFHPYKPTPRK